MKLVWNIQLKLGNSNGETTVESGGDTSTWLTQTLILVRILVTQQVNQQTLAKQTVQWQTITQKTGAVALGGAAIVGAIGAMASVFTRNKRKGNY